MNYLHKVHVGPLWLLGRADPHVENFPAEDKPVMRTEAVPLRECEKQSGQGAPRPRGNVLEGITRRVNGITFKTYCAAELHWLTLELSCGAEISELSHSTLLTLASTTRLSGSRDSLFCVISPKRRVLDRVISYTIEEIQRNTSNFIGRATTSRRVKVPICRPSI